MTSTVLTTPTSESATPADRHRPPAPRRPGSR